jgi:RND family efflux transporter MFP subunit
MIDPPQLQRAMLAFSITTCLVMAGCTRDESGEEKAATSVNVRTVVVTGQAFTEKVGALGTVATRPGRMASLSAPAPTRVARVNAVVGQHVAAGAPLIVLEQSVFREAERSAEAKLSAAQNAYERARSLSAAGILPRKDVEQAAADLASSRSDLAAARRTAQLSVLRSPISGVVTMMSAVLGASVDANQPLVEIADPSALDVLLGMTPSNAGRVRPGQKVEVRAGQSLAGDLLGTGTVMDVGAVVDSATRNVQIRVVVPTTTRPMPIGETVFGNVAISTRANVITVPVEAIVPEGDEFRIFVVDAKNVVHARPVMVGARDSGRVEIRKGLVAGERIVTYGAYGLEDGATIASPRS